MRKPKKIRRHKLNRDQTAEVVNELGDILNTFSLAIMNEMSVDALRGLAVKRGIAAKNDVVKQICANIAGHAEPEIAIGQLRERLGVALQRK